MTTKTHSLFKIVIAVLTSLSLVGCTTRVYNYNPVDPAKKIEYDKEDNRILRQDGKVITYDEAIKFLSEQEYSKSTMKRIKKKETLGRVVGLTGSTFVATGLYLGLTLGQYLVALLGSVVGVLIISSAKNDVLKAVDQHNAHIEQSTPNSPQPPTPEPK